MASWSVELWQPLGGMLADVADAADKSYDGSVDEGDAFSFTMDVENESARFIKELFTDVVVYRDGQKLYRGRITTASQSGDSSGGTISVSSVDYKTLLRRRFFLRSGTHAAIDLEQLAWNAIAYTQGDMPHGELGITRGLSQSTGINRPWSWEEGTPIKDYIDGLANYNTQLGAPGGFEWYIDPDLVFTLAKPHRGKREPTFSAEFGGSVLSYDTSFDPNNFANYWKVRGAGNYSAELGSPDGSQFNAGGRFEEYYQDSGLTNSADIDGRLFWLASTNGNIDTSRSYNVEIASDRWTGPEDLWLGDYAHLNIRHGALNIDTDQLRVKNMHITVEDSGLERIAAEIGYGVPATYRDFNRMSAFMLQTRRKILKQRASWYRIQGTRLRREWQFAVNKHGKNSYEAKASGRRYDDYKRQASRWAATSNNPLQAS